MYVRDPSALKQAIQDSGYSYRQIADYAELKARSFIGELANGNKTYVSDTAAKLIAGRLGRPVEELFTKTPAPADEHDDERPAA